jgi:hypothetical protein
MSAARDASRVSDPPGPSFSARVPGADPGLVARTLLRGSQ